MNTAGSAATSPWHAANIWTAWSVPESAELGGPLDVAVAATVVLDAWNTVIGWSPAAASLLGYSGEEVIGRPVDMLLGAHPVEKPGRTVHDLPPSGSDTRLARHRDGRSLQVVVLVCPLAGGGAATRILVIAELESLRLSETRKAMLNGLTTQSAIGLAVYDTDLRLTWANTAHDLEMGRPLAEYRGKAPDELYPDGTLLTMGGRTLDDVMQRVIDTGEPVIDLHFRGPMPSDPGKDHVWSCSYYRLLDADGRVLGVCEDAFDITDRYEVQNRLALLVEAGRRIGTTLDVVVTAREIADVAVPDFAGVVTVDVERAVLEGGDPATDVPTGAAFVRVATGSDPRSAAEAVTPVPYAEDGDPLPGREGEPVRLVRYPRGSPQLRSLSSGGRVLDDNTLVVPLRSRGGTMGLVTFVRTGRPAVFDNGEVALADELTARAAVSIDNARRFTRERVASLTLQRQLLPQHLPPQPAVDVAHRYLPTDAVTGVGGDWTDVIPLSGTRVGLVVGDIVGHGLQAAATMGRLRTTVEALARLDMPPDELLTRLDDLVGRSPERQPDLLDNTAESHVATAAGTGAPVIPQPDVAIGATCLYAVYDPVSCRCSMARAGHMPPAIVKPDGSCVFPDLPAGPPLGLGGMPFEAMEMELPEGSLIALFTDGLVEARDRDIDVGLDRLGRVLGGGHARPLEELCDRAVTELRPDGSSADDTALLLVRTRQLGTSQVAVWQLPAEAVVVGRARELVTGQLSDWGLDELSFATELVVSELVTNAIRYAEGPLHLRLIRDRALLCEVADAGHTSPHLRHSTVEDEGGRGLFIVAQLVQRWGTRYTSSGKIIWTEQKFPSDRIQGSDRL
ncbi:SpoIIE family protein phosphatase [Streptomyces sp. ISL-10]|uniref:SpoIIE family protein phosphatase n=1 Tax=Streptomyces sp. ISL-10 TaxID=2819172 RepID=UPI001BE8A883|nr:SpoIIE family protein phosphatase [Streptomyces sp. ISL-10]MBT2365947.1 SpoIIE family protein phosphatase [Streptomyces sp. ISL-10]